MTRMYQIVRSRIEYLVIILLTTLLVAVVITLASPKEYEASARILVVQKQQTIDAFSASKSADYIAGLLNEAIYSNSFVDSLVKTDPTLASKLSSDPSKRTNEWSKKVDSSVLSNKGILSIKVYDGDSKLALHYVSLIVSTLTSEGANYYGGTDAIDLRVIDTPLVTSKPARPSLATNIVASLLVGLALDIVYVFFVDVRLSRKLEEREIFGRLHPENEESRDLEFLRDGHVAPAPGEHVVSENFEKRDTMKSGIQPAPENPMVIKESRDSGNAPENLPLSEEPEKRINNWMKKS